MSSGAKTESKKQQGVYSSVLVRVFGNEQANPIFFIRLSAKKIGGNLQGEP